MDTTAPAGRVTSSAAEDAGRAALAALHEAGRRAGPLSARERAEIRDRVGRIRAGLVPSAAVVPPLEHDPKGRDRAPSEGCVTSEGSHAVGPVAAPSGRFGDVDINGDLVDELRPSRRGRAARLAAAITAATPALAAAHLDNILAALDRVPS